MDLNVADANSAKFVGLNSAGKEIQWKAGQCHDNVFFANEICSWGLREFEARSISEALWKIGFETLDCWKRVGRFADERLWSSRAWPQHLGPKC